MYDKCYSNQTLNMKSCFLDRLESPRPLWRPAGNGQRLETVWWRHWVAQVKTRRQQLPEKWPIPVEFPESKSWTCFNTQPGYQSISTLTFLEDFRSQKWHLILPYTGHVKWLRSDADHFKNSTITNSYIVNKIIKKNIRTMYMQRFWDDIRNLEKQVVFFLDWKCSPVL